MHLMEQILCPLRFNAKVLKMQNYGEKYANDIRKSFRCNISKAQMIMRSSFKVLSSFKQIVQYLHRIFYDKKINQNH